MKIHLDLISATDGTLLGVVKVNEMLYRQAQQEISCYGITLFQYLNLWFQELQTFPPKLRTHYLSTLAAISPALIAFKPSSVQSYPTTVTSFRRPASLSATIAPRGISS